MGFQFTREVASATEQLVCATTIEELRSVLHDHKALLLGDEATDALAFFEQHFTDQNHKLGVQRVQRAKHVLERCRRDGVDATLAAVEEEARVGPAVHALLFAKSPLEMRQVAEAHATELGSPRAFELVKEFLEGKTDRAALAYIQHRLALVERIQREGLEVALRWDYRHELFHRALNAESMDEADAVVTAHLDDFLDDQMGEVFRAALEENRGVPAMERHLHRFRSLVIEIHRRTAGARSSLTPMWLQSGEATRRLIEIITKEPKRERLEQALHDHPELWAAMPDITAAARLASSGEPRGEERRTMRPRLLEKIVDLNRDDDIENLFQGITETLGSPPVHAQVPYRRHLIVIEPWLNDIELPLMHRHLTRTLSMDAPSLELEIARYEATIDETDPRSDPLRWSQLHRLVATLFLVDFYRDRHAMLTRALHHAIAAARVLDKRSHPEAWASAHAIHGEVLLTYLGHDRAGLIEQKLQAISPTLAGRLEQGLRHFYPDRDFADQAIGQFELALQIYSRKDNPRCWAAAVVGIGTALAMRWRGNTQGNANESTTCFRAALETLSKEESPDLWAAAHARCGHALEHRSEKDQAVIARHLRLAAEVWDRERYTERRRGIQEHLSTTLLAARDWEGALAAIDDAIACSRQLADRAAMASDQAPELSRVSFLHGLAAYCLARLQRFNEAIVSVEQGTRVTIPSTVAEHAEALLRGIPPATFVVAPVVTPCGAVIFCLSDGLHTISASDVIFCDELNDATLSVLLVGQGQLPGQSDKGWLHVLGEWSERRADSERISRLCTRLTTITGQLWSMLVDPVVARMQGRGLEAVSAIVWIPHRGLGLLPLHAAWRPAEDGKREFLVDRYAVSYMPSLSDLRRHPPAGQHVSPARTRPRSIMTVNPSDYLPLRFAKTECETAARHFDTRYSLEGDDASCERVTAELQRHTHVHLACHGEMDWDDFGGSFLAMSDGPLTLREIMHHGRLDGMQLMVLSACETGLSEFRELPSSNFGFQSALLRSGVQCVVSSLWPVADVATLLLMQRFYQNLKEGLRADAALSRAQNWLRTLDAAAASQALGEPVPALPWTSDPEHPFGDLVYWAPFTATGA